MLLLNEQEWTERHIQFVSKRKNEVISNFLACLKRDLQPLCFSNCKSAMVLDNSAMGADHGGRPRDHVLLS